MPRDGLLRFRHWCKRAAPDDLLRCSPPHFNTPPGLPCRPATSNPHGEAAAPTGSHAAQGATSAPHTSGAGGMGGAQVTTSDPAVSTGAGAGGGVDGAAAAGLRSLPSMDSLRSKPRKNKPPPHHPNQGEEGGEAPAVAQEGGDAVAPVKRRPGRPPKLQSRGGGRFGTVVPRGTYPVSRPPQEGDQEEQGEDEEDEDEEELGEGDYPRPQPSEAVGVKRKRGRPRKHPLPQLPEGFPEDLPIDCLPPDILKEATTAAAGGASSGAAAAAKGKRRKGGAEEPEPEEGEEGYSAGYTDDSISLDDGEEEEEEDADDEEVGGM